MYLQSLVVGLLLSLFILAYFVRSPAFSLYHPFLMYSAFHFLIFVIRPCMGYWLSYHQLYIAYRFMPSVDDKTTVILAANLGYLAFAFFCLRAGNVPFRFVSSPLHNEERRRLAKTFLWVVAILGPLALYSFSRNFVSDGNFDGIVMDRATGIGYNTKNIGYITDLQLMLAPICAITAWIGRFRLLNLVPLIAFIIMNSVSSARGPFIAALAMTLLLYLYEKRVLYANLRLTGIVLAAAVFFSWVGADRGEKLRTSMGFAAHQHSSRVESNGEFLETMDLGNMEFFEYIVWVVPQKSGTYDYFVSNLQLFTEPVPRILWKNKPIGPPIQPIRMFEYGTPVGMTFSLPGVGWYELGWVGVFFWCGLWGHVTGTIYRKFCLGSHSAIKTAAYMIFLASLILSFRDGMLLTVIKQLSVYMAPVVFWILLARFSRVPRLADLARMNAGLVRHKPHQTPDSAVDPQVAILRAMPPAVRRRRLAMQMPTGHSPEG